MPANGDEGGDAAYLVRQEEAAQGNDVAAISMDGAGYRGPVLRELTEPDGLNLQVYTPPSARIPLTVFGPEQFTRSADGKTLTCPAGQTTGSYERSTNDTGVKFRFAKKQNFTPVSLRSEEHTSQLQSHLNLVCRPLL